MAGLSEGCPQSGYLPEQRWDKAMELNDFADVFSVAAGAVVILGSTYAFWEYAIVRRLRERRLVRHLKSELDRGVDRGQRTVTQLSADLSLTETQVLDAGFRSKQIRPLVTADPETGLARAILFQHRDGRD